LTNNIAAISIAVAVYGHNTIVVAINTQLHCIAELRRLFMAMAGLPPFLIE
jgi:hypothetical protein